MDINQVDGGAAFPIQNDDRPGAYPAEPGMSLRDYFAAMALTRILAHDEHGVMGPDITAKACYLLADEMLKARSA